MNVVLLKKEIVVLENEILRLKVENERLYRELLHAEYLHTNGEAKRHIVKLNQKIDRLEKVVSDLEAKNQKLTAELKLKNQHIKAQSEWLNKEADK